MNTRATIVLACILCTGCPEEKKPDDDGAGETTASPPPATADDGTEASAPAREPAALACEDELAKVKAEFAACEAAAK